MLRIVFLLVFSSVLVVHSANSVAVVEIAGIGLTIDDTIPIKYSYKFKEPGYLNLTCTVAGMITDYELILQNEHNIGTRRPYIFQRDSTTLHSVSHTFNLTPLSRNISCSARDPRTNDEIFSLMVDLKYEPDSTAAPSIIITTSNPTEPVPIETTTGPDEPQTLGKLVKIIVIAGSCVVIVVLPLVIIGIYRRSRKQVNPNEMAENIASRPPINLPPEVVYEEVYSNGAGLKRPRRQQTRGATPQHSH